MMKYIKTFETFETFVNKTWYRGGTPKQTVKMLHSLLLIKN